MQLLYQAGVPCPKYDAMYAMWLTNPNPQTEFYRYNQQLTDLYAYLSLCTGEVQRCFLYISVFDAHRIIHFYHCVECHKCRASWRTERHTNS